MEKINVEVDNVNPTFMTMETDWNIILNQSLRNELQNELADFMNATWTFICKISDNRPETKQNKNKNKIEFDFLVSIFGNDSNKIYMYVFQRKIDINIYKLLAKVKYIDT